MSRPDGDAALPTTVSPGEHAMPGDYRIVWWDPHALTLGARPSFGVRRQDLIVKDVPRDVVADGRSRYDSWRLARDEARAAGSVPTLSVATIRAWAVVPPPEAKETPRDVPGWRDVPLVDATTRDPARSGGPAFGALVHAILAQAPFETDIDGLLGIAEVEARVLGLEDEDAVRRAVATVERVLRHDVLRRAAQASRRGAARRETPVTCLMPDGTLLEGIVDLAFEEDGRWTVVDYKTDRDVTGSEEEYRRQVALYAAAIAQATGQPAQGVLVRV